MKFLLAVGVVFGTPLLVALCAALFPLTVNGQLWLGGFIFVGLFAAAQIWLDRLDSRYPVCIQGLRSEEEILAEQQALFAASTMMALGGMMMSDQGPFDH